jgi:branched-chain amino acid transport system ATP-binding protein
MSVLLRVRGLTQRFGGLTAVSALDFDLRKGAIKAIIGPNGAGKTTVFNLIAGVYRPDRGEIALNGTSIGKLPPHRRVRLGIARTFQNLQLFAGMTVLENVMVGAHARGRAGFASALLRLAPARREDRALRQRAYEILASLGLAHRAEEPVEALNFGDGKILEIARALASEPQLLLLDEPTAGLPHAEAGRIGDTLHAINAQGTTVLLVEHNMRLVMRLCQEILVLNYGERIAEGSPAEIQRHPAVLEAYLGSDPDA